MITTGLIDGDIFMYRICYSVAPTATLEQIKEHCDNYVKDILNKAECNYYIGILGIHGKENVKYTINPEYKGGRPHEKPPHWNVVMNYLISKWKFIPVSGIETDDVLMFLSLHFKEHVVISADKDLLQIPGKHYVLGVTRKGEVIKADESVYITKAYAEYFFYKQMLTGDSVDKVKGVPGIGKKKAKEILGECGECTPTVMKLRVMSEYKRVFKENWKTEMDINEALLGLNPQIVKDSGFEVPEHVLFKEPESNHGEY